ncbi:MULTISPECIES: hypothetical protein [unclassified Gluconobacter]|uniref:hypothetical protein n=1 Tax=unclassified Gluconobacter TaxID=2644261 RepID=UPI0017593CB0|nr:MULTISPECIES: hypothetical protein [unclassified Gluconobacter]GFE95685.1 hypothetical protein DmGdi_07580 [Gluconobacter sp. Gdi]
MSILISTPISQYAFQMDYPGTKDPFPDGDPMVDDPSEEEETPEPDEWPDVELPEEPGPSPYPPFGRKTIGAGAVDLPNPRPPYPPAPPSPLPTDPPPREEPPQPLN